MEFAIAAGARGALQSRKSTPDRVLSERYSDVSRADGIAGVEIKVRALPGVGEDRFCDLVESAVEVVRMENLPGHPLRLHLLGSSSLVAGKHPALLAVLAHRSSSNADSALSENRSNLAVRKGSAWILGR